MAKHSVFFYGKMYLWTKQTSRSTTKSVSLRQCHEQVERQSNKQHRMVNVYMYNKLSAIEEIKENLLFTWHKQLGVNGRVYLHPEGMNAQLSVPEGNVRTFMKKVKTAIQPKFLFFRSNRTPFSKVPKCSKVT